VLLAAIYPLGFVFASRCSDPNAQVQPHTDFTHLCVNFGNVVLCCYAIIFAATIILFEARIGSMHKGLKYYFGFMFSWFGRTAFIIFIGSIVIAGKWWACLLVGLFTFFVGAVNCCVICDHPAFKKGGKMATWGAEDQPATSAAGDDFASAADPYSAPVAAHAFPEQIAASQPSVDAAVAAAAAAALAPSTAPFAAPTAAPTASSGGGSQYGDFESAGGAVAAGFYDDADADDAGFAAAADPYSAPVAELDPYSGAPVAAPEEGVNPFL
jgi:hypothetical protein